MDASTTTVERAEAWNKGKLLGQKPPLKLKEVWAIRVRLQLDHRGRELALFNLAIDSRRLNPKLLPQFAARRAARTAPNCRL